MLGCPQCVDSILLTSTGSVPALPVQCSTVQYSSASGVGGPLCTPCPPFPALSTPLIMWPPPPSALSGQWLITIHCYNCHTLLHGFYFTSSKSHLQSLLYNILTYILLPIFLCQGSMNTLHEYSYQHVLRKASLSTWTITTFVPRRHRRMKSLRERGHTILMCAKRICVYKCFSYLLA